MISSCKTTTCESQKLELKNQLIGISSAPNARQLGGYIIGDKRIKNNLLIRSGKLSQLSEEDSLILSDKFRVQSIYDFRGTKEALSAPDVVPGNARYISLSISLGGGSHEVDLKIRSDEEMIGYLLKYAEVPIVQNMCTDLYDSILFDDESKDIYRQFFADLMTIDPENGAIIWHCTQGKDRAGCASAMLLCALGADNDLIVSDYTLSKDYYDPYASRIETKSDAERRAINTLITANPEIFKASLDKIDAMYGSFRNYLTECIGVTPEMMNTLRERYLE